MREIAGDRHPHGRADPRPVPSWVQADLGHEAGAHERAVRAWDAAGQTQPARPDETWNHKGYLYASWHRVRVTVIGSGLAESGLAESGLAESGLAESGSERAGCRLA